MTPSLNEIAAAGRKAARGAGFSWGLADEAGRATAWLWEHGIDGITALDTLLQSHETGCATQTCPIHMGTRFCDTPPDAPLTLDPITSPILLLSFAAELAKITEKSYTLTFGNNHYSTSPTGMYCAIADPMDFGTATLQSGDTKGELLKPTPRRAVNPVVWARIIQLGHRTYAPATEASRLAGAGAGLSDND